MYNSLKLLPEGETVGEDRSRERRRMMILWLDNLAETGSSGRILPVGRCDRDKFQLWIANFRRADDIFCVYDFNMQTNRCVRGVKQSYTRR